MTFKMDSTKFSDYDDSLRQVKGIVSAKVVTNTSGEVMEVHVLAGPDRNPKQVVRDIESVFLVNYGVAIDHKKISVAQLRDRETDNLAESQAGGKNSTIRPRIAGVTILSGGRMAEAKVLLEVGGNHSEGSAAGPGTASNKLRLISQATLLAIEKSLEGTGDFLTEDVSVVTISGCQAIIAAVSLMTNAGEERLIGAAFVNSDEREASVKATLAAVNRRIDMLLNNN